MARGNAVADEPGKHVEGDVLTSEFRDTPDGSNQLTKLTARGHVTIITKTDVTRGDRGVYDAAGDVAVVSGHVRITRADGTELTGDVGEVDFDANQSRLLNGGHGGRVRALLPPKILGRYLQHDSGPPPNKKQQKQRLNDAVKRFLIGMV